MIKFGFSCLVKSSESTSLKLTIAIKGAITNEIMVAKSTRALKLPKKLLMTINPPTRTITNQILYVLNSFRVAPRSKARGNL